MLGDKASQSSIKLLSGLFDTVITVPVNNPRSMTSDALAEKCSMHFNKVIKETNISIAFDKGYELAKENNSSLIICGSLYLAGEIRPVILEKLSNQQ